MAVVKIFMVVDHDYNYDHKNRSDQTNGNHDLKSYELHSGHDTTPFEHAEHLRLLISRLILVRLDLPLPEHLLQLMNLYPPQT